MFNSPQLALFFMEYGIGIRRSSPDLFELDDNPTNDKDTGK